MSNQILFYTQIGSIITFVVALFALYRLLVQQKDSTIELLKEKNQWLADQLSNAKTDSPDALTERLAKRVGLLEKELELLAKDSETNAVLIVEKEKELERTRELQQELENEIERHLREYHELESKLDLCPFCQSSLTELSYINLTMDDGVLRRYECGYAEIDGELMEFCFKDPAFPELDDFEVVTQQANSGRWHTELRGKSALAQKLNLPGIIADSPEESKNNAIAAFHQRKHGLRD